MKTYRAISLRKLEIKLSGMYGSFSVFKAPTPLLGLGVRQHFGKYYTKYIETWKMVALLENIL